jgi:hypothetical protein
MPNAGGTLFIASGPTGDHLFVIAFEPRHIEEYGSSEQVLLVPICTVYPGGKHDPACIVQAGEHSFVVHESYLDYRWSRIESVNHIRDRIGEGAFKEHAPVTEVLLQRVLHGLSQTKRMPRHIKDDFKL